jgi:hypothetical protein
MSTDGPGWSPSFYWNTKWLHRWLELLNTNKKNSNNGNTVIAVKRRAIVIREKNNSWRKITAS